MRIRNGVALRPLRRYNTPCVSTDTQTPQDGYGLFPFRHSLGVLQRLARKMAQRPAKDKERNYRNRIQNKSAESHMRQPRADVDRVRFVGTEDELQADACKSHDATGSD